MRSSVASAGVGATRPAALDEGAAAEAVPRRPGELGDHVHAVALGDQSGRLPGRGDRVECLGLGQLPCHGDLVTETLAGEPRPQHRRRGVRVAGVDAERERIPGFDRAGARPWERPGDRNDGDGRGAEGEEVTS